MPWDAKSRPLLSTYPRLGPSWPSQPPTFWSFPVLFWLLLPVEMGLRYGMPGVSAHCSFLTARDRALTHLPRPCGLLSRRQDGTSVPKPNPSASPPLNPHLSKNSTSFQDPPVGQTRTNLEAKEVAALKSHVGPNNQRIFPKFVNGGAGPSCSVMTLTWWQILRKCVLEAISICWIGPYFTSILSTLKDMGDEENR